MEAALAYLARYAASTAAVRRVLMRRVERSAREHGTDRAEARGWVEDVLLRLTRQRMLDDRDYAKARAGRLHRRGASERKIAADLAARGLDHDLVLEALGPDGEVGGDLSAAIAFVRRKRLGPCRPAEDRERHAQKDLGSLARAGFSRAVAERVLACMDRAALDELETGPD